MMLTPSPNKNKKNLLIKSLLIWIEINHKILTEINLNNLSLFYVINKKIKIQRQVDLQKQINNNNLKNITYKTNKNSNYNVNCWYLYIKTILTK